MAEDISNFTARIEELKQMVRQIMVDTHVALIMQPKPQKEESKEDTTSRTWMPIFYTTLLRIASGIDDMKNKTPSNSNEDSKTEKTIARKTESISNDTAEIRELMSNLTASQEFQTQQQNDYYNDLLDNTEAFVDNSEEEKKNGNILSRMMGTMKGAITGFIGGLFAPKPKVVILSKATIKDIAGIVKAYSPSSKASFTDKIKDKASGNIVDALTGVITKVGKAIATAVKAIEAALIVFIYFIFPAVLLGAIGVLVVGLFFIAKMIMDTLGDSIAESITKIAGAVETVASSIAGAIDKVYGGIGDAIKSIAGVITTIGNTVGGIVEDIGGAIKSIAKSVVEFLSPTNVASKAVSGVKSFLFGDEKTEVDKAQNPFSEITEPICTAINDFNSMVKNYLSNLKIAAVTSVIRTNVVGDTRLNTYRNTSNSNTNENSNSYNRTSSNVRNSNSNTSTPADGTSNNSFNKALTNKYSYEYSSNSLNNSNQNNNEDVVKQIKETNSLMNKLIELLTPKRGNSYSLVGD